MNDTKAEKLAALLEQWAGLEPERCLSKPDGSYYGPNGTSFNTWAGLLDTGLDNDRIQGAVQEAIEARGWGWWVYGRPNRYSAKIYTSLSFSEAIGGSATEGESRAAALLYAYLKALRANK